MGFRDEPGSHAAASFGAITGGNVTTGNILRPKVFNKLSEWSKRGRSVAANFLDIQIIFI